MIALLTFIGIALLLILEGALITSRFLGIRSKLLNISLALPLTSLLNLLLILALTIARAPIKPKTDSANSVILHKFWASLILIPFIVALSYGFSHSILLPSFQYDSFTHWAHRSKLSFYDQQIAFDETRARGMRQPQYPLLYHSLQITSNQLQSDWNDRSASGIQFILMISIVLASFIMMSRLRGRRDAVFYIALLLSVPLFTTHMGQGYADITMAGFVVLSCISLLLCKKEGSSQWLVLSSLMIAAACMTKLEGILFGLIPWIIFIGIIVRPPHKKMIIAGCLPCALCVIWFSLVTFKGISILPHETDLVFAFRPEGVPEMLKALFVKGSFGILWLVLPVILLLKRSFSLPLLWGLISLAMIIVIYLFTPNVEFLLNGQSFDRQILTPAALLILALFVSSNNSKIAD